MNREPQTLRYLAYCRKSSEDDRQAASIGDQLRELAELVVRERLTLVQEPLTEEKSAKAPGRPVFSELCRRIENGHGDALLCWDIDRLYRNPIDEGRVRWLLQRGILREIRTPFRVYLPQDAGLLMGVEGGRATDHIITLRKGVLRGFRGKLERGERPGPAPPGYLNDRTRDPGDRRVIPDPERFPLVRRAWDLMLMGRYSVRDIQQVAETHWGLRSRRTKRQGGKPLAISTWYRIFSDPFYYGWFWWKTPGGQREELYRGSHTPMVTREEWDRVQEILGRPGRTTPQKHEFAYTGLITCGECGCAVTAEEKLQVICSSCRHKFASRNRDECPRCEVPIAEMTDPTHLRYVYYHCTKKGTAPCRERAVREEELDAQIERALHRIALPARIAEWAMQALRTEETKDSEAAAAADDALRTRLTTVGREIEHLNRIVMSPDTDWSLVSQGEVRQRKHALLGEQERLASEVQGRTRADERSIELTERTFVIAAAACSWFKAGNAAVRKKLVGAIGSNPTLAARKLEFPLRKPFLEVTKMAAAVRNAEARIEPTSDRSTKTPFPFWWVVRPCLLGSRNVVRTYWREAGPLETLSDLQFLTGDPRAGAKSPRRSRRR